MRGDGLLSLADAALLTGAPAEVLQALVQVGALRSCGRDAAGTVLVTPGALASIEYVEPDPVRLAAAVAAHVPQGMAAAVGPGMLARVRSAGRQLAGIRGP